MNCVPIIARICGFILTDGSLGIYHNSKSPQMQVSVGHPLSIKEFENDIQTLGFQQMKPVFHDGIIHGVSHKCWQTCRNGPLPSLLIALGIMYGKKQHNHIFLFPTG
jgi:hypothetical protein